LQGVHQKRKEGGQKASEQKKQFPATSRVGKKGQKDGRQRGRMPGKSKVALRILSFFQNGGGKPNLNAFDRAERERGKPGQCCPLEKHEGRGGAQEKS